MEELEIIGGASIGMASVSSPLGRLTVTENKLELNASLFGNCSFAREDVISLTEITGIIGGGILIKHRVPQYKPYAMFWTRRNAGEIIDFIKESEFWTNHTTEKEILLKIRKRQAQGQYPLKRWVIITFIVSWNTLFLIDVYRFFLHKISFPLSAGAASAIALAMLFFVSLLSSGKARNLLLKPGRELKDIDKAAYFSLFVFGALLFMIIAMPIPMAK